MKNKIFGRKKGRIFIYGLKDRNGKYRYAGATINPEQRSGRHKSRFPRFKFTIIRRAGLRAAQRLEVQIMKALKKLGQCDFNKALVGRNPKTYCPSHGIYF